ncbi:hydantoinase B/oxoprolinase family protein [uncultured Alsobacter sp.]|uniref:hydantoinase B/oxoprolinase family protein n=1 Tax=uncultured Alsobacter sp. TaxID=1748258 RepID=UPI0025F2AD34|nr:hydantoinase B/oxoprolinase family protein [uncultured Alsobacter sp.]
MTQDAASGIVLDPVDLEIFFHKFTAVAEEMAITLQRAARTTYVKEAGDFGTALASPGGRFFAYPRVLGVSGFLDSDVGPSLEAIPDLEPGDVIITNHPYASVGLSTHMPDLHLIRPIFHEGRIVAHAWDFIHSADVGGGVPSSISPRFSDLFQEGFQIPPMKLMKAGVMNADFLTLYRSNCRTPDVNLGDINAMLAALAIGERRVHELIAAHGVETFMQAQRDLVAYAAAKARQVQRRIPDGDHVFWDYLDDDYNSPVPVRLRCCLKARDGHVHLDFTGSDPQVEAAYNVPTGGRRHVWLTLKLMHFVYSTDRTVPLNYGLFENITVEAPSGTIVNPEPPAAVGVRAATAIRINEALVGAMSVAKPGLMPAPSGGVMIPSVLVEQDPATGARSVMVLQSLVGGTGAREGGDGVDGRDSSLANQRNTPIEKTEEESAAVIVDYALRPDSGGAGRWRGGTGVVFSVRIVRDGSAVLGRGMERFVFRPWGMAGGKPGANARVVLNAGTPQERDLGKLDMFVARAGDVVTIMTPGGGGFGDPLERPADVVRDDVVSGYVSRESALADYGVVLDGDAVDEAATRARRDAIRRGRPGLKRFDYGPEREAWDTVFDDASMLEFNALLMRLPTSVRSRRRREIFDRVVPGLSAGVRPLQDAIGDPDAARARLKDDIEALRRALAPGEGETRRTS